MNNQKQEKHHGANQVEPATSSTSPPPQVLYHSDVCSICMDNVCMLDTTTFGLNNFTDVERTNHRGRIQSVMESDVYGDVDFKISVTILSFKIVSLSLSRVSSLCSKVSFF